MHQKSFIASVGIVCTSLVAVLARPADAQSFVENDVHVIHLFSGEAANDQFGWVTARTGDLDGDDVDDLIITAPGNSAGRGRVYVYSSVTGKPIHTFTGTVAGGQFGNSVADAGLIDADNTIDIIVGAPAAGSGRAQLFSGATGTLIRTLLGETAGDRFGDAVRPAGGDIDGDGTTDLLIGAPRFDSAAGSDAGRVYQISGADGSQIRTRDGRIASGNFGSIVAPLDDLDGDGIPEFGVGAPNAGPGSRGLGFVFPGAGGPRLCRFVPESSGQAMGDLFMSAVGDLNGDGISEIYITDWQDRLRGGNTGRVYVYSWNGTECTRMHLLTGPRANEGFGIGNGQAGDVNLDGVPDLLIGSWVSSDGAPQAGKVEVFDGANGALLRTITSTIANETLGFDAHTMGDVTGDGYQDFLLSAAWNNENGFRSGKVYLVAGNPPKGDMNCDAAVNAFDIEPFLAALFDPATYMSKWPDCDIELADMNRDGSVNAFDIEPFLQRLFP